MSNARSSVKKAKSKSVPAKKATAQDQKNLWCGTKAGPLTEERNLSKRARNPDPGKENPRATSIPTRAI